MSSAMIALDREQSTDDIERSTKPSEFPSDPKSAPTKPNIKIYYLVVAVIGIVWGSIFTVLYVQQQDVSLAIDPIDAPSYAVYQKPTVQEVVDLFGLQPHPEGGYYTETYRSDESLETPLGTRDASTAILFLVTRDSVSHFHRLATNEGWHFYAGDPLHLTQLRPDGNETTTTLGHDLLHGHTVQHYIPAGDWFAGYSLGDWSLVGCTVAPGFDFADFEMGTRAGLLEVFPQHSSVIEKLTIDGLDAGDPTGKEDDVEMVPATEGAVDTKTPPASTKLRTDGTLGIAAISHINVIVNDDIETGAKYYEEILGFIPAVNADGPMHYTNITNHGFCVDAGFEKCRVDIIFLKHEVTNLYLELFFYYEPSGSMQIPIFNTNDAGGIRHIAVEVSDAVDTYNRLQAKDHQGTFVTKETPIPLDPFPYTFFYWIDRYGVQWEFEQGRPVEYGHIAGITG